MVGEAYVFLLLIYSGPLKRKTLRIAFLREAMDREWKIEQAQNE